MENSSYLEETKRRLNLLGYKNLKEKDSSGILGTDILGNRYYFEFFESDNALSKWTKDGKTFLKMMAKQEGIGDIMELIDLNNTFCKATRENYNKLIKLGFKNPCELRKSDAFLSLHNNIIWMGKTSAVKKEIFLDENNNWKYKKINSEKINNKGFS